MSNRTPYVECDECGKWHPATYSHNGRYSEGPIYAVVCTSDDEWMTDYYTSERLAFIPDRRPDAN